MDQEIRNKLRNVVTQCRTLLEKDIRSSLEGKFRIYEKNGEVFADPKAPMGHLEDDEEREARAELLDHLSHIKARGFKPKDALDQLIREIAFTHLNRLCAYKMMEAREVYVGGQKFREAVSRGVNSNGVKFYLAEHPDEERLFNTGHQDVAYRHFLDWLGGALSDEIGVLFNPNDPANRLYPRQKTLDEVLDLLNGGGIKAEETELREQWPLIWSQDETIGWVYQYFTPKELRDQARKESQAPRNSYELAFRNQFFTPRYVVEFLTDNTLGRIWYEMRKGDTKFKDQCRYMVRRPAEIFLKDGDQPPNDAAETQDDLSQEELLKLPVHIPHRPKKDPRELKILDPACGSGHFLLYCFDLLLTIYEEAYADPDLGPALKKDYPTLDALKRDAPRLILAHNLHGIDIDLRASQIAALALWLRCQRAYQEMGFKKDRPKITRSNFVCAEPMPGEEQMLKEFVGQLEPKVLGQVVGVVFDKMKLAGEAGSLLKIEEEIRDAIREAKRQYAIGGISIQRTLFDKPTEPVVKVFSVKDITDAQFFEGAEAQVIEALRSYAEKAQNGQRLQRRLFSEDAVRGFAFVDLCQKRYDVVLMNPPFGDSTGRSKSYVTRSYSDCYYDLFSAFVDRGASLLCNNGRLGAITSRTGFFLSRLERWRKRIVFSATRLQLLADLGQGVLDTAMVETSAYVVGKAVDKDSAIGFFNLLSEPSKGESLLAFSQTLAVPTFYLLNSSTLEAVPGAPLSYWAPSSLRALFRTHKSFFALGGEVKQGLASGDDFRFLKLFWEVPQDELGAGQRWVTFCKGGTYRKYYYDPELVVDWSAEAQRLYRERTTQFPVMLTENAPKYVYRKGLTYPQRTQKGFNVRQLPANSLFGAKGPAIFPLSDTDLLFSLGVFNSRIAESLIQMLTCFGSYNEGYVGLLPFPECATAQQKETIAKLVSAAIAHLQLQLQCDETSHLFEKCDLDVVAASERKGETELASLENSIEMVVADAYGLSNAAVTSSFTEMTMSADDDDGDDEGEAEPSNKEPSARALSYLVGLAIGRFDMAYARNPISDSELPDPFTELKHPRSLGLQRGEQLNDTVPNGILVDDAGSLFDIVFKVRECGEQLCKGKFDKIEDAHLARLDMKDVRDYFRKPGKGGFWDDHISRYSKSRRKAPIYWLLQSSKKNYAIWLYYHRLDKDLLFKSLVNYVEPKIRLETSRLESLRAQSAAAGESGKEAKRLAKEVEKQEDFISELRDFEDKLRRAANLHLDPDLNDGVVLNIAPLHELVPWKEAKKYWDELMAGKYEWSSIGKQLREKGLVK